MYKLNKSEREILLHKFLHSAVYGCKLLYCIFSFILGAYSADSHKSALFPAKLVATGEVIVKKEAGVSHETVFTYKAEFTAYGINRNGIEVTD